MKPTHRHITLRAAEYAQAEYLIEKLGYKSVNDLLPIILDHIWLAFTPFGPHNKIMLTNTKNNKSRILDWPDFSHVEECDRKTYPLLHKLECMVEYIAKTGRSLVVLTDNPYRMIALCRLYFGMKHTDTIKCIFTYESAQIHFIDPYGRVIFKDIPEDCYVLTLTEYDKNLPAFWRTLIARDAAMMKAITDRQSSFSELPTYDFD